MALERKTPQHGGCATGLLQVALFGIKATPDCSRRQPLEASTLWRDAIDPRGTLVEDYLNGLGIDLPDEAAFEAIRFYPRAIDGLPGMLCLIRNILDNEPQAIRITRVVPKGAIKSRTLGTTDGGAIKIDPDENAALGICVGAGLERCLAARQLGFAPIWALDSAIAIKRFPVLAGIEGLTIFVEDGEETQAAAQVCFDRWMAARRDVVVRKLIAIRGVI